MKSSNEELTRIPATSDLALSILRSTTHGKFVVIAGALFSISVIGFGSVTSLIYLGVAGSLLLGGFAAEVMWLVLKFRAHYLFDPSTGRPRVVIHGVMAFIVLLGFMLGLQSIGRALWPSPGGREVVDLIAKGFLASAAVAYYLFLQGACQTRQGTALKASWPSSERTLE